MSGKRLSKRGGGRAGLQRVEGLRTGVQVGRMPGDKQGGYQPAPGITDEGGTRASQMREELGLRAGRSGTRE